MNCIFVALDSLILNDNEKNILINLLNESKIKIRNKIDLIYRGSRDGWRASDFHKNCDNKGSTVSFIETKKNNVFGGYTTIPWTRSDESDWTGEYHKDKNAFLFLIRSCKQKIHDVSNAVNHYKDDMCVFGEGFDIRIVDRCNENKFSSTTAFSYKFVTDKRYYLNGDKQSFQVTQIEVYTVT